MYNHAKSINNIPIAIWFYNEIFNRKIRLHIVRFDFIILSQCKVKTLYMKKKTTIIAPRASIPPTSTLIDLLTNRRISQNSSHQHFLVGPSSWLSCPEKSRSIECASDVWPWAAGEHCNRYDERAPGLPTEKVRFHASYTRLYYHKYDSQKTVTINVEGN